MTKIISTSHLTTGQSTSCGCKQSEHAKKLCRSNTIHGHKLMAASREYMSWQAMRQRNLNPNHEAFERYGGAGIKICKRWNRFENFLADMGVRPPNKTLDRYPNPYGDYKPSNCRWATPVEQRHNRRKVLKWKKKPKRQQPKKSSKGALL